MQIRLWDTNGIECAAREGRLVLSHYRDTVPIARAFVLIRHKHIPQEGEVWKDDSGQLILDGFGVKTLQFNNGKGIVLPFWLLILFSAVFITTPWLPYHRLRRFSLKTLLIVTAIVSAVLGLLVWLLRG
jgi:hypothetical protein